MLLGRKRKQDAAAAAVAIQDKRTHVVIGEVRNHKVTIEDLLENSNVESEYEGASDSEDADEKENELHTEPDADFIQWQRDTLPLQAA